MDENYIEEVKRFKEHLDECRAEIIALFTELQWGIRRVNNLIETLTAIENDYQALQSNREEDVP